MDSNILFITTNTCIAQTNILNSSNMWSIAEIWQIRLTGMCVSHSFMWRVPFLFYNTLSFLVNQRTCSICKKATQILYVPISIPQCCNNTGGGFFLFSVLLFCLFCFCFCFVWRGGGGGVYKIHGFTLDTENNTNTLSPLGPRHEAHKGFLVNINAIHMHSNRIFSPKHMVKLYLILT